MKQTLAGWSEGFGGISADNYVFSFHHDPDVAALGIFLAFSFAASNITDSLIHAHRVDRAVALVLFTDVLTALQFCNPSFINQTKDYVAVSVAIEDTVNRFTRFIFCVFHYVAQSMSVSAAGNVNQPGCRFEDVVADLFELAEFWL